MSVLETLLAKTGLDPAAMQKGVEDMASHLQTISENSAAIGARLASIDTAQAATTQAISQMAASLVTVNGNITAVFQSLKAIVDRQAGLGAELLALTEKVKGVIENE